MPFGTIFRELKFPSGLRVRNRIFPSNVSGRFDNYNGTGPQTRINWEVGVAPIKPDSSGLGISDTEFAG